MRRQRTSVNRLALMLCFSLLAPACGDDDDGAGAEKTGKEQAPGNDEAGAESESDDGNILDGDWQATAGQADAIEATLTSKGYECSSHADKALDIRMCAKGIETADDFGSDLTMARLRFMAADDGTVVMAAIDGDTAILSPPAWDEMKAEIVEALLPPEDAAVLLADGTTLSWGTVERGQVEPDDVFLKLNGFVPPTPYVPDGSPFTTTTEAALPLLQSAGLNCTFGNQPSAEAEATETPGTGELPQLSCLDPSFTSDNEDGSIEGATAEAILVDGGQGIAQLSVEGRHGSVPDDTRGVEQLLPKVIAAIDEEPLPEVQGWVESHLDGLPHSAYVGSWQVTLYVTTSAMVGDSVAIVLTGELPDFGAPSSQIP